MSCCALPIAGKAGGSVQHTSGRRSNTGTTCTIFLFLFLSSFLSSAGSATATLPGVGTVANVVSTAGGAAPTAPHDGRPFLHRLKRDNQSVGEEVQVPVGHTPTNTTTDVNATNEPNADGEVENKTERISYTQYIVGMICFLICIFLINFVIFAVVSEFH